MPDSEPQPPTPEAAAIERLEALPRDSVCIVANGKSIDAFHADMAAIDHENRAIDEWNKANPTEPQKTRLRIADQLWGVGRVANKMPVDAAFSFSDLHMGPARNAAGDRVPMLRGKMNMRMPRSGDPCLWTLFPARAVRARAGLFYASCSEAYALLYAQFLKFRFVRVYGFDLEGSDRACCEFWIGAMSRAGQPVSVPNTSTLLDANIQQKPYGYDEEPEADFPTPRFVA